jgi:hypothetical protein
MKISDNSRLGISIGLLVFGLVLSLHYKYSFCATDDIHKRCIEGIVATAPFMLGMLMGSRVLSNDAMPKDRIVIIDYLFVAMMAISMALAVHAIGFYIGSYGGFIVSISKKRTKDLTPEISIMLAFFSCVVTYFSSRLFRNFTGPLMPVICFFIFAIIFLNTSLHHQGYQSILHVLVIASVGSNIYHSKDLNMYIFLTAMFVSNLIYLVY